MEALLGLVGIGNLVCLIMVVIKLFKDKGVGWGIFGIICSIYTLIWGWQNVDRHNMRTLMIIWTILYIGFVVLRAVVATTVPSN
jgi:hypothetical protein